MANRGVTDARPQRADLVVARGLCRLENAWDNAVGDAVRV